MSRYRTRLVSIFSDPEKGIAKLKTANTIECQLARKFREILQEHRIGLERFEFLLNKYCQEEVISETKPLTQDQIIFQLLKSEMSLGVFRMALRILGIHRVAIPTSTGSIYLSCH